MDEIKNEALTLDLSALKKTRVKIKDGDDFRDLYLNLSDMNLLIRFKEKYEELSKLGSGIFNEDLIAEGDDLETISKTADALKEIDVKMRELLDYIFDANVSEVCAPSGSMYDIVDGKMRYEYIMEALSTLYEENIAKETKKMSARLQKHTSKYVH